MSDTAQPLIDHLIELRRRLMWIIGALLIAFILTIPFAQKLYAFVAQPLIEALPHGSNMIATEVIAPFLAPIKVALMTAFLITLPHTLYQIWAFVAPALYQNEKRLVVPLVLSSLILFLIGMLFAYFLVFPIVFRFMASVTPEGVNMATDINHYLSFVMGMFIAFGTAFEVPIVVILLNSIGIVSTQALKTARPYVIVGAFILAAIITPPDVLSQILMAIPLILLYETGIWATRFVKRQDAV